MVRLHLACGLFLFVGLVACSSLRRVTPTLPVATPTPTLTPTAVVSDSGPGCYYVWATKELPQLSQTLQAAMQTIVKGASGSAYGFGEDCVASDGTRKFLAMETDFRVRLPVQDLSNEEAMGNLIAATMQVIEALPPSQIEGPRPGRVEFEFAAGSAASLRLVVQIDRFRVQGEGLTGAALFNLFYTKP